MGWLKGTDRLRSPADPHLDEQEQNGGEGIEFCRPQRDADKRAAGFHEVQCVEESPVEVAETEAQTTSQKGEFENRMPRGDQIEQDGDGKEFPGKVSREPDHVERPQKTQELVVVADLREREGLVEPEPVLEVVGEPFPGEGAGFEVGELLFAQQAGEVVLFLEGQSMDGGIERQSFV